MITAAHLLIYSDDAPATRAFLRDVLRWPFVSDGGTGGGGSGGDAAEWLIFAAGASEVGVHPTSGEHGGQPWSTPRHHEVSLMCDDLDATIAELTERGAEFSDAPRDLGFGRGVRLRVPGADDVLLYQPHHAIAYPLVARG